jgi:PPOX class probable F420-dependent enzyme
MAYHQLTDDEVWAFLDAHPPHTGKLATTRADGGPHVVPIWYVVDGREIVFTTGADTVKGRALRRDGRCALSVDDERPPYTFVLIEGTVALVDDPAALRRWAGTIGGRYMGADRADEFGARNGVPGELLVRLRPAHVTAATGLTD